MKFGAVSCSLLAFLIALVLPVSAQETSEQEDAVRAVRLASLWQDVSGVTETMVQSAANTCRPALDASLAECDTAVASAPDDPETIELHPYCRKLSNDEFIECVKAEINGLED